MFPIVMSDSDFKSPVWATGLQGPEYLLRICLCCFWSRGFRKASGNIPAEGRQLHANINDLSSLSSFSPLVC